jgi:hypothetical protein
VNRYGHIEEFPPDVLGSNREPALLYKQLATLRIDAPLFANVDALRWSGSTPAFTAWAERIGDARLVAKLRDLEAKRASSASVGTSTPPLEARP